MGVCVGTGRVFSGKSSMGRGERSTVHRRVQRKARVLSKDVGRKLDPARSVAHAVMGGLYFKNK